MKTTASTLFALVTLLPSVFGLTFNTPMNVAECEPTLLTWTDGTPPYYLSLIPGGQPSAPAVKVFPAQQGTSYSWTVDVAANTALTGVCKDSTGETVYTSIFTVGSGVSTSCVNATVTEGVSGTASGASSPTSSVTGGGAAQTTGSTTSSAGGASHSSTSSGPSSTSSSSSKASNGAFRSSSVSAFGVAGVMGLVGAALF